MKTLPFRLLAHAQATARTVLATAALALFASTPTNAIASDPDALRAAVTFNIIRYVAFPESTATHPIDLCLIRGVGGARQLNGLHGRTVGNRVLSVRQTDADSSAACDVVFVAQTGDIARVSRRGVLVIGDGPAVLGAGGAVGLVRMGGQTRFEVNTRAAQRAGLTISSRLLRLASRVQQ